MTEEWELLKPQILQHVRDGWSSHYALRLCGIGHGSKMAKLCYRTDVAFRKELQALVRPALTATQLITR